mmetsp:Transcript_14432/g.47070  ORF Transcript_14432/g.47070 Transcript_14432/m.47070 type:complete len:278 (-) Transcript_14432:301-1134(-)
MVEGRDVADTRFVGSTSIDVSEDLDDAGRRLFARPATSPVLVMVSVRRRADELRWRLRCPKRVVGHQSRAPQSAASSLDWRRTRDAEMVHARATPRRSTRDRSRQRRRHPEVVPIRGRRLRRRNLGPRNVPGDLVGTGVASPLRSLRQRALVVVRDGLRDLRRRLDDRPRDDGTRRRRVADVLPLVRNGCDRIHRLVVGERRVRLLARRLVPRRLRIVEHARRRRVCGVGVVGDRRREKRREVLDQIGIRMEQGLDATFDGACGDLLVLIGLQYMCR